MRDDFGFDARTITGRGGGAARRSSARRASATPDGPEPVVVIDIGGGSTEFVVGEGGELVFHVSTQTGAVRQTERHVRTDPPTPAEVAAMRAEVREIIDAPRSRPRSAKRHARGDRGGRDGDLARRDRPENGAV